MGGVVTQVKNIEDTLLSQFREQLPVVARKAQEPELPLLLQSQGPFNEGRRGPLVVPAQEQ